MQVYHLATLVHISKTILVDHSSQRPSPKLILIGNHPTRWAARPCEALSEWGPLNSTGSVFFVIGNFGAVF
jgi:hypothetical protein